jgi:osmoprotectant transport system substrate-binding protein/osmoprotectant transport system permease protein
MRHAGVWVLAAWLAALAPAHARGAQSAVVVGSKAFPESWILAEALARTMRLDGIASAGHRHNLGGTEIVAQALRSGAVDVYPEYTGTIQEVLLHRSGTVGADSMRAALAGLGLGMSDPIGFNDGYAIAMPESVAARLQIRTISDLGRHADLRLGLTHEFLGRADGYPGLARHYGLRMRQVLGIQHELAYTALASGRIDATDIYTTDAQIARLGLRVLEDDRRFFPRYDAVWLYRLDLPAREPRALLAIRDLTGRISEAAMIRANARVVLDGISYEAAADSLLAEVIPASVRAGAAERSHEGVASSIARNTLRHLELVLLALAGAIVIGLPLGILAAGSPRAGSAILLATGVLQTIPSLALLAVLIPLLGIGFRPALAALFLYSLLPIVRNTVVGLSTLPTSLRDAAESLPLTPWARLTRIRLPMAAPSILAGIQTSAVICVGSATLAALVGAGGLGEPILSGIQLRQTHLILEGAVPAAALALLAQKGFDLVEKVAVPRGLRRPEESTHGNDDA